MASHQPPSSAPNFSMPEPHHQINQREGLLADPLQGKYAPKEGGQAWGSRVVTALMREAGKLGGCQGRSQNVRIPDVWLALATPPVSEELCIRGKTREPRNRAGRQWEDFTNCTTHNFSRPPWVLATVQPSGPSSASRSGTLSGFSQVGRAELSWVGELGSEWDSGLGSGLGTGSGSEL